MSHNDPLIDLDVARTWLNRAASALSGREDSSPEAVAYGQAAATVGHAFIALAYAGQAGTAPVSLRLTSEMPPALVAAIERRQRAAAEARPHDDELTAHGVGSLSEAIALALGDAYAGIEFEDPTFERGTEAVMAVLRERAEAGRG